MAEKHMRVIGAHSVTVAEINQARLTYERPAGQRFIGNPIVMKVNWDAVPAPPRLSAPRRSCPITIIISSSSAPSLVF